MLGDGDDLEVGRQFAQDFDDFGSGSVFEAEVENDQVDLALVLVEGL